MSLAVAIDARKIADFGIGTYVRGLLSGIAEIGGSDRYVIFVGSAARDLVPSALETVVFNVPNYTVRELPLLGSAVRRARVDVFHSAHFVIPFTSTPSITTIHDVIPLRFPFPNPVARVYYRTMIQRAVRKSARVLTVTEASKAQIAKATACPPDKIAVTPNGVGAPFGDGPQPEHSGRYFVFAGNDKPHKNAAMLLEAFELAQRADPSLRLVITGAPYDQFRGREGVALTGWLSETELAAIYRGALALVMPSLEEGFGLPALEAMACGTPVITSMAAALIEITGDAALHADATSAAELAGALALVASDADLRRDLGHRGRARAASYTWRRCAELTLDVYRTVAREVRHP